MAPRNGVRASKRGAVYNGSTPARCSSARPPLLLFVHLAFYLYYSGFPGEQGRYLLPLAPLFGAAVAASSLAAGRRLAPVLCTIYVTALACLATFSYGLAMVRYYT